jgi:predicted DNA-binding transcriptional regulator YafY
VSQKTVDMIYKTMSRGGEENRRKVDPYKVMFFDSTFYLIGLCHLRSEIRMFVLDRIKMMNITDETFEIPDDFDLETYMQSPFKVIHDKPVKVTIRFDKKAAGYIKEKIWHHSQDIEPQKKDGSIIFTAEVAGTDEVKHWVMSWGKNAEVIEPKFLRQEIASELEYCIEKYEEISEDVEQA